MSAPGGRYRDPEFVARIRAEAVAQGLPPTIEDEAVYRIFRDGLAAPRGGERGAVVDRAGSRRRSARAPRRAEPPAA